MERSHWKLELPCGQRSLITVVVLPMTLHPRPQIALVIKDEDDLCLTVTACVCRRKIVPLNGKSGSL